MGSLHEQHGPPGSISISASSPVGLSSLIGGLPPGTTSEALSFAHVVELDHVRDHKNAKIDWLAEAWFTAPAAFLALRVRPVQRHLRARDAAHFTFQFAECRHCSGLIPY